MKVVKKLVTTVLLVQERVQELVHQLVSVLLGIMKVINLYAINANILVKLVLPLTIVLPVKLRVIEILIIIFVLVRMAFTIMANTVLYALKNAKLVKVLMYAQVVMVNY